MTSFKRALAATAFTLASALPFVAGGCADDLTHFDVKHTAEFQKGGTTVSILGVFREGRMSPETWDDIGAKISPVFGRGSCSVGFDSKLVSDQASLAEVIDDYARENGVTDDLLDQLAPAASGDTVLIITVAGRPAAPGHPDAGSPAGPTQAPMAGGGGRGMGRRGSTMGPAPVRMTAIERDAFEMSASLFSLHDHHTVALVSMGYSGQSGAEALQKFVEKLRESFAGDSCVGWNMDSPIDQKKIEAMTHE